jgi:hypothetical protein
VGWKSKELGWFDEHDVRHAAYWALLAGAHGHTYGCHPVWRMYDVGHEKPLGQDYMRHYWHEVLDLPGAWQMLAVRRLMQSRPMLDRAPDQSLIAGDAGKAPDRAQAARGKDYAFIYMATGKPVTVAMGKTSGAKARAWWFDPRNGQAQAAGEFENTGQRTFDPPGEPGRENDWVLVLDDAAKGYAAPGAP